MPDDFETTVAAVITNAQQKYRFYYETCLEAYREKENFVPELLMRVNGPPDVPEKYRLWRCDAIWKEDGRPQPGEFELDSPPPFAPLTEKHPSGVLITLHPIVWHRCEFYFKAPGDTWKGVDRWQTKWLDEQDRRPPDKFGLAGVIHWLSQPSCDGAQYSFLVDFGSAPPDAFHELVSALGDAGAREVTVASFGHTKE